MSSSAYCIRIGEMRVGYGIPDRFWAILAPIVTRYNGFEALVCEFTHVVRCEVS